MTILGYLRMNEEMLRFDPTIRIFGDHNISTSNETIKQSVSSLTSTLRCWSGDSLLESISQGGSADAACVTNVARYYHYETVRVRGANNDIQQNIRKGLDVTEAANYRPGRAKLQSSTNVSISRKGRSTSAGVKRPSSDADATLPPIKRSCLTSPTKASGERPPNRVHRRVILCDYGKPIYKASSAVVLLSALEGCVEGHELLYNAGPHRDISINNLMVNEDDSNPSWRAFLIDLDLAIIEERVRAKGKTGTRAFMAIGALLGEQHSFMHDLESFFWVLFWTCIHCNGPNESIVVPRFEKWNYVDMRELAELKKGQVSHERDFIRATEENYKLLNL
ncbi:unnamed protein product [Clonostachys solani]|uniref:Fungal-type protein kinase domain-containing protein n=1 Tax=Clonostachys solani TaxID=160281 RepID=A0A9P0EJJ7_9HYPO|nr:unnamed protein product [Clonostachys solani]